MFEVLLDISFVFLISKIYGVISTLKTSLRPYFWCRAHFQDEFCEWYEPGGKKTRGHNRFSFQFRVEFQMFQRKRYKIKTYR